MTGPRRENNIIKNIINRFSIVKILLKYAHLFYEDITWEKDKKIILREALLVYNHPYTIDLSKRYGFYIFHNKKNTLIARGPIYEREVQNALLSLMAIDRLRNKKHVYFDIGANIGLHVLFMKREFPDIDIVAFDPSPLSWIYLELTLKYNNINNTILEKYALSDKNSFTEFYNFGEESSADSLKNTNRCPGVKPNIIQVQTRRMDDIDFGPLVPSVIKMDCEGSELSILTGAIKTIKSTKPLIMLEFHPVNKKAFGVTDVDIFSMIESLDYHIFNLNFDMLDLKKFISAQDIFEENYILLPNDLIKYINNL